ncbi:MAG: hypothetical protein HQK87_06910, partial [Nitrospinae bacterium]|nr:hypothetical protein [Nitrospinota bacterium]
WALTNFLTSAKISTEGPRAINVFYVTNEQGGKIEDLAEQERIVAAVVAALTPAA